MHVFKYATEIQGQRFLSQLCTLTTGKCSLDRKSVEWGRKAISLMPFLKMQLSHEWVKIWTTNNKHDRMTQINHSFKYFKYLDVLLCLVKNYCRGKKWEQQTTWNAAFSQPRVTEAEGNKARIDKSSSLLLRNNTTSGSENMAVKAASQFAPAVPVETSLCGS